jgi:hypothetical protein
MKKIIIYFMLLFCGSIFAQTATDYLELTRSVLQTEKKAAVIEAMQFTDKEAENFWPLYEEYNAKLYKVQNLRIKVIKDFAENFDTMTDEKADNLWKNFIKFKEDLLDLQENYYGKFKKILPAAKVVRYFQLENKIEMLINANIALEIPLLEEGKK